MDNPDDVHIQRRKLPLRWRGNNVVETMMTGVDGKAFSRKQIREHLTQIKNALKEKGIEGYISSAIKTEVGWRTTKSVSLQSDDDVDVFDVIYHGGYNDGENDPKINQMAYFVMAAKPAGGCLDDDSNNDCLYDTLSMVLGPNAADILKNPAKFKKDLGLKRTDKVHYNDLSKVEKILEKRTQHKYKINCSGDFLRLSPVNSVLEINVVLSDGHYTLKKNNKKNKIKAANVHFQNKNLIIYKHKDKETVEYYDGESLKTMNTHEFNIKKLTYAIVNGKKQYVNNKYIYLEQKTKNKMKVSQTLIEEYEEYNATAKALLKESNGLINLFKTGTFRDAALNYFERITKTVSTDNISQDEALYILNATYASVMYAKKGYTGDGYKYDFISNYPSIMSSKYFLVPVKKGTFKNLSTKEFQELEYFQYGIYRCKITCDNPLIFKTNSKNYYTHYDLTHAKKKGLSIELIQDDQPNCLIYSRDCLINGSILFKDYVDTLFQLKQKKVSGSKDVLNILWGALCQKKKKKLYITSNKEYQITNNNTFIESIKPAINETDIFVNTYNINSIYLFDYARLGPFLLAYGRKKLLETIHPYIQNIKWAHTDGFITDIELPDLKVGSNLGDLKYEGYSKNCIIHAFNNLKF